MNYKVGDKVRSKYTCGEYVVVGVMAGNASIVEINGVAMATLKESELEPVTDYLTTDEFIKEAEALKFNIHEESGALVIRDRGGVIIAKVGTCFPLSVSNMSYCFNATKLEIRQKLYDLLDRYARTPLEKRVAEKRFKAYIKGIMSEDHKWLNEFIPCHDLRFGNSKSDRDFKTIFTAEELAKHEKTLGFNLERVEED